MKDNTVIMIPARYASTRYPAKPLADLGGVPMVRRVYDKCVESGYDTFVLTDDRRIAQAIPETGVYYDTADYNNGTERCAGAVCSSRFAKYVKVINVQGDMPDVTTEMILQVDRILENHRLATVFAEMSEEQRNNPNAVKMIRSEQLYDKSHKALWFGRGFSGYGEHHLGIYGYNKFALERYPRLAVTREEQKENLEQLRWLKCGFDIYANCVTFDGIEINTPEDAELWNKKNSH